MRVVITGANRGIGLALVKEYISRGCEVWGACRQASQELSDLDINIVESVDVSSTTSVNELVARLNRDLSGNKIDILINNAGILGNENMGNIDYAAIMEQFSVNAIGPLKVTESLLPLMATNSKVALVTSRMGSASDNGSGGYYGYRMSKAALNIAGVSMARDLARLGIAVAILHPGFVQTDMVGFAGDISASTSAQRLASRIDALNINNSGTFWHSNGDVLPW